MGSSFPFCQMILNICPTYLTCLLLIIPQRIRWGNEFESTSKHIRVADRYKVFLVFLLLIALQLPFLEKEKHLFLLTISLIFSTLYPPCGAVWPAASGPVHSEPKTRFLDLGSADLLPEVEVSEYIVTNCIFLIPRLVSISITNGPVFCGMVGAVSETQIYR